MWGGRASGSPWESITGSTLTLIAEGGVEEQLVEGGEDTPYTEVRAGDVWPAAATSVDPRSTVCGEQSGRCLVDGLVVGLCCLACAGWAG